MHGYIPHHKKTVTHTKFVKSVYTYPVTLHITELSYQQQNRPGEYKDATCDKTNLCLQKEQIVKLV